MKVFNRVIIDIESGRVITEESFYHRGPVAELKGGSSPPPPAPPPAYEPPPQPPPPPEYEPPPSPYEEESKEELEKAKKKIKTQAKGRGSTILTGLLTEAPETKKTSLKAKLGE